MRNRRAKVQLPKIKVPGLVGQVSETAPVEMSFSLSFGNEKPNHRRTGNSSQPFELVSDQLEFALVPHKYNVHSYYACVVK